MPTGVYTTMDGRGLPTGREEFRCAPGPAGWRYVSTIHLNEGPHTEIVDLAVDERWRPVRLRIDTGSSDVLLTASNGLLRGVADGSPVELQWKDDIDYLTPCFNVATANRLGRTEQVEVLYLEPISLKPRLVAQRYELLGPSEVETPAGRFGATQWRYTALESGFSRLFWISADVLIRYEGVFELAAIEPGPGGPFPL